MKTIITAVIISLSISSVYSQWVIQEFNPDYSAICFNGSSTGYVSAGDGIILKSTNNGHTWSTQYSGATLNLYSISFFDENKGWAVGMNGTVLKTTNGGVNWTTQVTGFTETLWDVEVARADTAVAVGLYDKLYRTTNGGTNWSVQTLGSGTSSMYSVYFYSYSEGYACGGSGNLYSTSNAGANWVLRTTASGAALLGVTRISSTIIAVGTAGTIIRSTNSGVNWSTIPSGTVYTLFSVASLSPSIFVTVADDGSIFRSSDGGASFYQAGMPPVGGFDLKDVTLSDSGHVIAAGDAGSISYSTNLGANWIVTGDGTTDELVSIHFPSPLTGYAVSSDNELLKTTNGGNSWTEQPISGYSFTDIKFINPTTGFVSSRTSSLSSSGSSSSLYKTTNGGINWVEDVFNNVSPLESITFADAMTGWVLGGAPFDGSGANTILLKTTNGGSNWQPVHIFTENVEELSFISSQTGWAAGFNGFMQKTTNGGANWLNQNTGVTDILYSVFFLNSFHGYACGGGGKILITTNGGTNWFQQSSGVTGYLYAVHFGSSSNGICIGEQGTRLRTTNGGLNWINQPEPAGMELGDCFMPTSLNAYVCGPMGYIANYGGVITATEPSGNIIPSEYKLMQNYPNPFNPVTNIEFQLPGAEMVQLKVFNLLGEEVASVVDELLQPGSYKYTFDGIRFSSGVYFYRLTAGTFAETKKMILIK